MAEQKIGYEDFFDKELFKPVIDSLQNLLEAFRALEKELKTNAKQSLEDLRNNLAQIKTAADVSTESVRKVANAAADVSKSTEALKELEKTKAKLEKKLNELNAALNEETQNIIKLKAQIKLANNEIKDRVKQLEIELKFEEAKNKALRNSFATYRELSETLEILRAKAKDMMAANQENTEEFKELSKIVNELDERIKAIDTSLGQFQRLVGSYKESIIEAFSNIATTAVGASTEIGKITVTVFQLATATYKAQGGVRGLSSAFSFLGKTVKSVGIILALEALVAVLSKLREVFFPTSEEILQKQILEATVSLSEARVRLMEQMNEQKAKLLDLEGDDLATQVERLKIQSEILRLQEIELQNQLASLEKQKEATAQAVSGLAKAENQLGFFGRVIAKVADLIAKLFERLGFSDFAAGIRKSSEELLQFAAKFLGSQKELNEKRKELLEIEENIQRTNESILEVQAQQKRLAKEILEIQRTALQQAIDKLFEVESRASTKVEELIRRYDEIRKELLKSFEEAQKLLGAGFEKERAILEEEFRRRRDLLEANFAKELAEIAQSFIVQSANIVKDTFPSVRDYLKVAIDAIVEDQTKAINRLINDTKDFLRVVEAQVVANSENADELERQAEAARSLVSALEKVKESYRIRAIADFVKADIEALKEYYSLEMARTRLILQNISDELAARKRALSEKELLFEQEKAKMENLSIADLLLLRRRKINMEELLEKEKEMAQERLDIEREFEERRIELERQSFERRKAALEERLKQLQDEIASAGGEIPAQVQSLLNSLESEILSLDLAIAQLNARSAEVAQNYLQNTAKLSLEYAKKYAEAAKKEVQDILSATDEALKNINTLIKRRTDERLKSIESEKDILDQTINLLTARAEAGSLKASESIAELLSKKRDLEKQEQELRRQQQRRELLLTALQAYSSALQRNSQSPLADTIRDITALSQFIQSLPTFYTGTEYVSSDNAVKIARVAKDAFLARLHEGERVVPAHINAKLKGVKNEDLPHLLDKKEFYFDFDSFRRALVSVIKEANRKRYIFDRL